MKSKLDKSKIKTTSKEIRLFSTEAPNLIGLEDVLIKEKYRSTTVTCISETAEVIKIRGKELIPRIKEETLKELVLYAKSKMKITQDVVESYTEFQTQQYLDSKRNK